MSPRLSQPEKMFIIKKMVQSQYDQISIRKRRKISLKMMQHLREKFDHQLTLKSFQTIWSDIKRRNGRLVNIYMRKHQQAPQRTRSRRRRRRQQQQDCSPSPPAPLSLPQELEAGPSSAVSPPPVTAGSREGMERSRRHRHRCRSSEMKDQRVILLREVLCDLRGTVSHLIQMLLAMERRLEQQEQRVARMERQMARLVQQSQKNKEELEEQRLSVLEIRAEVLKLREFLAGTNGL
ncbi:uncharacterized protein [Hyperolius riggenbachi]|uniref:uncharacterized protein n=1 Tax=Hyperolius riggenbachi TaxID=752182 RepID=UPI0035A3B6ED